MDAAPNAFVLALYRAARRMLHPQFRAFVFERLQELVTLDSAFWYRWAADAQRSDLHAWCLYRQPDSLIQEYASEELWRDDIVYERALAAPSGKAVSASYDSYTSPRMRSFLRRHRQEHVLTLAIFQDVQGIATGMSMYRNETRSPWSDADHRLLEAVMPHVVEAWRENWLQDVVRAASSSPEHIEFSLAVLIPSLMLSEAQDNFADLMHLEWPDWRGPWLPKPLHAALLVRAQPTASDEPWIGQHIVVYSRSQVDGNVVLFVRRGHEFDRLAPRRREAAVLFGRGSSQTDVASRMQLSASTVNNYLAGTYAQLNLSDKTELSRLVARLEP